MPNDDFSEFPGDTWELIITEIPIEDYRHYKEQRASGAVDPFDGQIVLPAGAVEMLKRIASREGVSLENVVTDAAVSLCLEKMYGTPPTREDINRAESSVLKKLEEEAAEE